MSNKKHQIEVYPFSYNKIVNNVRKIDIRPFYKSLADVGVGDIIEFINVETREKVARKVKGMALFDDFNTAVSMLDEKLIGYSSKEEIKIRIERMYSKKDEEEFGVVAFFIDEVKARYMFKLKEMQRAA